MKFILIGLTAILCFHSPAYAWTEYKNIRYVDLDGDSADEIVIESKHGAGYGHYIEDVRIFKDAYPALELMFTQRTLDSYSVDEYNYDVVSIVEFSEPNQKSGIRDIMTKTEKKYYKDNEHKVFDRTEDLGTKIFKWDGVKFGEANVQ
ncbi:MAG: hypothetical protein V1927_00580 [Candidatus Omnitrophota bacterium]